MKLFKKKEKPIEYNPETQIPAIWSSICTGESAVGFINKETGKFSEYALVRSEDDIDSFCKRIGIASDQLKHIF